VVDDKVLVVLDRDALILLERILVDRDPAEALDFVLRQVAPQVQKRVPCLALELTRPRG